MSDAPVTPTSSDVKPMDAPSARYESLSAAPASPTPSLPKQHLPKKDADQPSPQIQSQAMSGTSLPIPMSLLPLGNPPVQHSMVVPGLQPHPMQSQGMMHQGQGLNFSPRIGGPQLSPQLGNMGMSLAPQFPQQPAVKYSSSRKTVKIIHPETHEELNLDSSQVKQVNIDNVHTLHCLVSQIFDKALAEPSFCEMYAKIKQVNIDNVITLHCLVSQIFDKAVMEPSLCEMYANLCFHLAAELPELCVDNERITFKRLLLNKCQEEFERGEREEQEANKAEEEGEVKQSEEEREEKRIRARRRMLGNIRLIGELYKKRILTERIMHECISKLLGQPQNPDEENIEALCQLMSTIGEMIDHQRAKEHMDAYYDIMAKLSNNMKLSSRVRFMLRDAIDLRNNNWQQRRKVEGPKKIEDVHRDVAQD